MTETPRDDTPFLTRLRDDLRTDVRRLSLWLADAWGRGWISLRNAWRAARRARVDYVVITIEGPMPERSGPPRGFLQRRLLPPPPLSLQRLNAQVQRLIDADNVGGVVLRIRSLGGGLATLQSVRRAIDRLNAAGKDTVAHLVELDLPHYYVASAASRVLAPESARFEVLGLFSESIFLKDTLARAGVQAEFVQISPYKTAPDTYTRHDMSPEMREQLDWLLDDLYAQLLDDMAKSRGLEPEALRAAIDRAPMSHQDARDAGLLDGAAYEDDLARLLGAPRDQESQSASAQARPARLMTYARARPLLRERYRRRSRRAIGVISIVGTLGMGPSRRPPLNLPLPILGGSIAGEETIVAQIRRAERARDLAALVIHVDSRGGSALASDLIYRDLRRLAERRPVVVYMGDTAASGGYYVSAPAARIVAQPATLTGSIGVLAGRVSLSSLYELLDVGYSALQRGARADLFRSPEPFTDEQRRLFAESIEEAYLQFKHVVADGRQIEVERLDPLCEGRVWTGKQAVAHGLVDQLGDFQAAVDQAAALAGLPRDRDHTIPLVNLTDPGPAFRLPRPASAPTPAEPGSVWARWLLGEWLREFQSGRSLFLLPFDLRFW